MKHRIPRVLFGFLAAVPAVYFLALKAADRPGTCIDFSLVCLFASAVLLPGAFPETGPARLLKRVIAGTKRRKTATGTLAIVFLLPSAGFFAYFTHVPESTCTDRTAYLVVLGCGVKQDGNVSLLLKSRLDEAAEIARRRPLVKIVVTGGKLRATPRSEADAMREYLVNRKGIADERVLVEGKARDTIENLRFSATVIRADAGGNTVRPPENICILTSDFHLARALFLARREGYADPAGAAARFPPLYFPIAALRETGAWWKLAFRLAARAIEGKNPY
jgi:uncharacterized SAM-binding protein YcdF (DUF218 family)